MLRGPGRPPAPPAPAGRGCQPRRTPVVPSAAFSNPTLVPQRQMLPSSARLACSGVGIRRLLEQRHGGHHEARRAEPAHRGVVIAEGLLHRVERLALGDAFDGADVPALRFDGQHRARVIGSSVDDHRAGAARAAVADAFLAGDLEARAQRVEQRHPRLHRQRVPSSIHGQRDGDITRSDGGRSLRRRVLRRGRHGRSHRSHADGLEEIPPGNMVVHCHNRPSIHPGACTISPPVTDVTPLKPARAHGEAYRKRRRLFSPPRVLALSIAGLILGGAILLSLPISAVPGRPPRFSTRCSRPPPPSASPASSSTTHRITFRPSDKSSSCC